MFGSIIRAVTAPVSNVVNEANRAIGSASNAFNRNAGDVAKAVGVGNLLTGSPGDIAGGGLNFKNIMGGIGLGIDSPNSDLGKGLDQLGSFGYLVDPSRHIRDAERHREKMGKIKADEDAANAAAEVSRQGLEKVKQTQNQMADEFRKQMPGMQSGLLSSIQQGEKRNLAERIRDMNASAAGRGLVRSGISQLGRAQAVSESAQTVAERSKAAREGLQGIQRDLDLASSKTALDTAGLDQATSQRNYQTQLEAMRNRMQGWKDVGSGLGSAAGSLAARNQKAG